MFLARVKENLQSGVPPIQFERRSIALARRGFRTGKRWAKTSLCFETLTGV